MRKPLSKREPFFGCAAHGNVFDWVAESVVPYRRFILVSEPWLAYTTSFDVNSGSVLVQGPTLIERIQARGQSLLQPSPLPSTLCVASLVIELCRAPRLPIWCFAPRQSRPTRWLGHILLARRTAALTDWSSLRRRSRASIRARRPYQLAFGKSPKRLESVRRLSR